MKRMIDTNMWADAKVDGLDSDSKLLWAYILTAPQSNLAGCYELTMRRIEVDTGLKPKRAAACLENLNRAGLAVRSTETDEVLVKNWKKHNWSGGSSKLEKPLAMAIKSVKDKEFREYLSCEYQSVFGKPVDENEDTFPDTLSDTLSDRVSDRPISISISNTVPNTESKEGVGVKGEGEPAKHKHGKFSNVLLADSELESLKAKFPDDWQERIDDLSYYIGSKGNPYKSHYRTILSWARRDSKPPKPRKGVVADERYAKYR